MSKLSDKIKQAKKSMEIKEKFKDVEPLKKELKKLKEQNKVEFKVETESKWDKLHETSDYKRYIYRMIEGKSFRGTNKQLDEWIKKKDKQF